MKKICCTDPTKWDHHHHHHHQPINAPIAGAQAFLMDYPQGERAITHHTGPVPKWDESRKKPRRVGEGK
jgi:hypothetical protein